MSREFNRKGSALSARRVTVRTKNYAKDRCGRGLKFAASLPFNSPGLPKNRSAQEAINEIRTTGR
jgi:hypothetical protein